MINLRENIWAVEVPSMAFGFDVNNYGNSSEYMYMLDVADIVEEPHHDETLIAKPLPPGTWEIVCTSKECTGDQASDIVEWEFRSAVRISFRDYLTENTYDLHDATQSINTLLMSKGCDLNKNWLILKKQ